MVGSMLDSQTFDWVVGFGSWGVTCLGSGLGGLVGGRLGGGFTGLAGGYHQKFGALQF